MADETTTLCTLVRITRTDTIVVGLTDLDQDIDVGGVTYLSASGYTPSDYVNDSKYTVGDADISGLFTSAGIDLDDVSRGIYDYAAIDIYLYDFTSEAVTKHIAKGWWGQVKTTDNKFSAEFRSITTLLRQPFGRVYDNRCSADFCDGRCGLDAATYQTTVTASGMTNSREIPINETITASGFKHNTATFTTGNNAGLSFAVRDNSTNAVQFYDIIPYTVESGDSLTLLQNCDKTFDTCTNTYNNAINFRGYPSVPTRDEVLKVNSVK